MMHGAATPDSLLSSRMWHENVSMSIEPSTLVSLDVRDEPSETTPHRYKGTPAHHTAAINSVDLVTYRCHVSSHASSRSTSSINLHAHLRRIVYLNTYDVVIKGGCLFRILFSSVGSHFTHHTAERSRYFQPHFQASDVEATGVAALTTAKSREGYPSTFCRRKEMNGNCSTLCVGKFINHVRRAERADRLASVLRTTSFDAGVDREWNFVSRTTREPRYATTIYIFFSLAHVLS